MKRECEIKSSHVSCKDGRKMSMKTTHPAPSGQTSSRVGVPTTD